MQARLRVVQENANLKQVKLLPVTLIGRAADCQLKIASTQVSRKHCRITVTDREVLIEDLNSANGTLVNQQKIPPGESVSLPPGTTLQIGPAEFVLEFTPPMTLENMPTTVLKSSEVPAAPEEAAMVESPGAPPQAAPETSDSLEPHAETDLSPLGTPPVAETVAEAPPAESLAPSVIPAGEAEPVDPPPPAMPAVAAFAPPPDISFPLSSILGEVDSPADATPDPDASSQAPPSQTAPPLPFPAVPFPPVPIAPDLNDTATLFRVDQDTTVTSSPMPRPEDLNFGEPVPGGHPGKGRAPGSSSKRQIGKKSFFGFLTRKSQGAPGGAAPAPPPESPAVPPQLPEPASAEEQKTDDPFGFLKGM